MSSIRSIDIRLDLNDCSALYDYNRGERVEKPEKCWDTILPEVKRLHDEHVLPRDKCGPQWQDFMDHTWDDKKLLERRITPAGKASQSNACEMYNGETIGKMNDKNNINWSGFNFSNERLPSRVLPVYRPGDIIKGEVVLDLTEPMSADRLVINLAGRTMVQVRTYHFYGYHDDREQEDYVNETQIIWRQRSRSPEQLEFSSMTTEACPMSEMLPAGISIYPFEFLLPQSVPGSVPPLIPSTAHYAHLVYRLKATLIRGTFERNIVVNRGLWVERPFDVASIPESLSPAQEETVMNTGIMGESGPITLRAQIPCKALLRSGHVPITVQVENHSPDELVKVEARVVLQGKNRVGTCMSLIHKIDIKSSPCEEAHIAPGTSPRFQWQIPLDFTPSDVDSNLMPVGTLHVSKWLEIQYAVVVTAKRKICQWNLKLEIPIIIGTENTGAKFGFTGEPLNGVKNSWY